MRVVNAEMLKSRPQSGQFPELHFDAYDETISVKFEDQNYSEFCGVFGGGFGSRCDLAQISGRAFIISFGQGYIFDIERRELVHKTECDQLEGVLDAKFGGYFVAHSQIRLFVYASGLVWSSPRVSADGILMDKVCDGVVHGRVYNFSKWVDFSLSLENFEYICDWECNLF